MKQKTRIRICSVMILGSIIILSGGCGKIDLNSTNASPDVPKYSFSGYIKNFNTKEPLQGVLVTATRCSGTIESHLWSMPTCNGGFEDYATVNTDENGYFELPYDSKAWEFSYEKSGYEPIAGDTSDYRNHIYYLRPL